MAVPLKIRISDGFAEHIKERRLSSWDPDMGNANQVWDARKETGPVVIDRKTFQEDKNMAGDASRIR